MMMMTLLLEYLENPGNPLEKISPGKTLEKRPFLAKTLEIPWKKIIADLIVRDMCDLAFFQVKIFFPPSAGSVHYQA